MAWLSLIKDILMSFTMSFIKLIKDIIEHIKDIYISPICTIITSQEIPYQYIMNRE